MRSLIQFISKTALLAVMLAGGLVATASAQDPKIQMAHLDQLAAKASETVDVNIDERLVQIAIKVFDVNDPDEAKVRKLVSGLKGIYVKSFEFDSDNMFSSADLDTIRMQLREPAWARIAQVKSKRDTNVEVYLSTSAGNINGLVVISSEARELTVVNIVGPIDLDKLADLEGNLGIPNLGIEKPKAKTKNEDQ